MTLQEEMKAKRREVLKEESLEGVEIVKELFRDMSDAHRFRDVHFIIATWSCENELYTIRESDKNYIRIIRRCDEDEKKVAILVLEQELQAEGIIVCKGNNENERKWILELFDKES